VNESALKLFSKWEGRKNNITNVRIMQDTVVQGQGRQKNNSKNKNQNFEEIIFSKKSFFAR
jgi:hypothetical protein